ncbi:hypothetical protein ACFUN7_24150 [Streptomyces sp. NPDC057236]|uniref:hypothetical protein n=1 Tax=Streptomyces sp. NPDC057236 TaxID=3346059 RepID=UPI00364294A9
MSYTPIARGTTDWNVPVNSAFADQDERITALENARVFARKTADESVTNSTTYQNDDGLLVPVTAGATYIVEGFIVYNTASAAGIKLQLTGPTGTGLWGFIGLSVSGGNLDTGTIRMSASTNGVGSSRLGGAANDLVAIARGTFLPTASGNLVFQWAQNAANATPTVVRANSWLSVHRIA